MRNRMQADLLSAFAPFFPITMLLRRFLFPVPQPFCGKLHSFSQKFVV
jgi:hypothetical protein